MQVLVSIRTVGLLPKEAKYYHFVTFLDCPVLIPFFWIMHSGRTAGPIFTLYGSNDVFPRKDGPFGVRTMSDVIWGNMPQNPQKWA